MDIVDAVDPSTAIGLSNKVTYCPLFLSYFIFNFLLKKQLVWTCPQCPHHGAARR